MEKCRKTVNYKTLREKRRGEAAFGAKRGEKPAQFDQKKPQEQPIDSARTESRIV